MSSFNRVILVGNLTREPELRVTPRGTAICQFGIATNRRFKDEAGNQREEVTFVDVEAWGKAAELVAKYLSRGSQALVEGRLKLDQWEEKTTGQKRQKLKVVLESVQFLGRPKSDEPAPSTEKMTPVADNGSGVGASTTGGGDEDVPF